MCIAGIKKAVAIAGGQTALASKLGKRQSHVWTWINRDKKLPAELVIDVARALDWQILPHEIRPDIYPHHDDGLPDALRGQAA